MKTIKLYQVNCNLLFNNDEEISDFAPNKKGLFQFQPSLKKALDIYNSICSEDFDKKEVLRAKIKGFGSTYTKYILYVEMPLKLYVKCLFEDDGTQATEEKTIEYLNDMVWHEKVNWKLPNIQDVDFDIDWQSMQFSELRPYKLKTA